MKIAVFGANGPTGLLLCNQALHAGHHVNAVVRRPGFTLTHPNLQVVLGDVMAEADPGVRAAVEGCDAALSVLGCAYTRKPIALYSVATRHIIEAMRIAKCRRLVVVSSGLTYPTPTHINHGWFFDYVIKPILRNGFGRTLYADMRRMEELLRSCTDLEWTVMRPARLTDEATVSNYLVEPDFPSRHFTSRADLAASMVAELTTPHLSAALSPTTC